MAVDKGRNRTGSLYRRWKGKKFPVDDPEAIGKGIIWLRYMVAGTVVEQSLKTTDIDEASRKRAQLMAPLVYADEAEVSRQLAMRMETAQKRRDDSSLEQNPAATIENAWEEYLKSPERPDTGDATLKYYVAYWTRFRDWLKISEPGIKYLRDILSATAKEYAASLNSDEVSPNTYNKHIGFLKLLFTVLAEPAGIQKNPFDHIRKKKLKTNTRRELTIAELKDIIEKAEGQLQTLFMLGTFTGLRQGDCCTLKWSEVDLDRRRIRRVPNKTASSSGKTVVIGIPEALYIKLAETPKAKRKGYVVPKYAKLYNYKNKDGRATRQPDITKEIQKHLRDRCGIQIHKEGTGYKKVSDPTGKHEYIWEYTGKRAVVEVGFHSLRHTYVSLHAENGTPQAVVQAVIGHGNPAMTAHYTHIGEKAAVEAAGALGFDPRAQQESDIEVIDPLPEWAQKKLFDIAGLVLSIKGKQNEKVKGYLLQELAELVPELGGEL